MKLRCVGPHAKTPPIHPKIILKSSSTHPKKSQETSNAHVQSRLLIYLSLQEHRPKLLVASRANENCVKAHRSWYLSMRKGGINMECHVDAKKSHRWRVACHDVPG